jgi:hypothetical protein
MGFPERGSVRISELESVRGKFGLPVERDRYLRRCIVCRSMRAPRGMQRRSRKTSRPFALPPKPWQKKRTRQERPHCANLAAALSAGGGADEIDIAATVWVRLCPDGTDVTLASYGDHAWRVIIVLCAIPAAFSGVYAILRAAVSA